MCDWTQVHLQWYFAVIGQHLWEVLDAGANVDHLRERIKVCKEARMNVRNPMQGCMDARVNAWMCVSLFTLYDVQRVS